jgi:hypothetical protein
MHSKLYGASTLLDGPSGVFDFGAVRFKASIRDQIRPRSG